MHYEKVIKDNQTLKNVNLHNSNSDKGVEVHALNTSNNQEIKKISEITIRKKNVQDANKKPTSIFYTNIGLSETSDMVISECT